MWDMIWYLGFPMFAIGVFGAPHKNKYDSDADGVYNSDNYDVVYDQRQNGSENYKLTVDGLSLVWSPNSLFAAAALLEPALYGEYPTASIEELFGPLDGSLDESTPINPNKTTDSQTTKVNETSLTENKETSSPPTVLVIEGAHTTGQKHEYKQNATSPSDTVSKRKLRFPGLLKPFLSKRSSPPEKVIPHN